MKIGLNLIQEKDKKNNLQKHLKKHNINKNKILSIFHQHLPIIISIIITFQSKQQIESQSEHKNTKSN